MAAILVLHGPNLNLLGTREPHLYGRTTLAEINQQLSDFAAQQGAALSVLQSNAEHVLVDRLHATRTDGTDFVIINPGGLTHTSVVLRDALAASERPFIEVHLSNIHAREAFRRHSYISELARGVICGLGAQGYEFALRAALHMLSNKP
jgi:3-dehydroquinate dehydratase-2